MKHISTIATSIYCKIAIIILALFSFSFCYGPLYSTAWFCSGVLLFGGANDLEMMFFMVPCLILVISAPFIKEKYNRIIMYSLFGVLSIADLAYYILRIAKLRIDANFIIQITFSSIAVFLTVLAIMSELYIVRSCPEKCADRFDFIQILIFGVYILMGVSSFIPNFTPPLCNFMVFIKQGGPILFLILLLVVEVSLMLMWTTIPVLRLTSSLVLLIVSILDVFFTIALNDKIVALEMVYKGIVIVGLIYLLVQKTILYCKAERRTVS